VFEFLSANILDAFRDCTFRNHEFFLTSEKSHIHIKKGNAELKFTRKYLLLTLSFMLVLQACGPSQRFLQFNWNSSKHEVIDSLKSWKFTHNPAKDRWEYGMLNGYRCDKLRVWFGEQDHLEGVEAKYLDLDSSISKTIFDRYVTQTTALHGEPDRADSGEADIAFDRRIWIFSPSEADTKDITTIVRFVDYVIFHAARNAPEPIAPQRE
jgi:hypothetical protein